MEAPPSRYRVVERGGRLVVIDSAVGGAPLTARQLLPDMASDDRPSPEPAALPEPVAEPLTLDTPVPPPRPAAARAMIAEPPGALASIAATVCGDARDDDGRLNWETASWYDAKAPRRIALSTEGEQQLGSVVVALVAGLVIEVMLLVWATTFGIVIGVITFSVLRQVKPAATRWIDRLERT